MAIEALIKEYWEIKSQQAILRMRENLIYNELVNSLAVPIKIPYLDYYLDASIETETLDIVPMRYLPYIDQESKIAKFYDGRVVKMEAMTTKRLIVKKSEPT